VKDIETFQPTQAGKVVADQILRACGSISANIAEGFANKII
jgi:four helix bundle protein